MKGSNADFTDGSDVGFTIYGTDGNIEKLYSEVSSYSSLITKEKKKMFYESTNISGIENTIAMSDGFDIDDDGVLYAGVASSSNGTAEASAGLNWCGYLVIANLADLESTKHHEKIFDYGATDSNLGASLLDIQNVIAKKTDDNIVTIICSTYWTVYDNGAPLYLNHGIIAKTYNLTTKAISESTECTISVDGTVYQMKEIRDYVDGTGWVDTTTKAEIEAIWLATGIEHPVGYSGVNTYNYYLGNNPVKYGDYYYGVISIGNQSHTLCKTLNLIDWEFVCDIPFGQATEEACVCFYGGNCYATSRGNDTVDGQYSKIMYCSADNLVSTCWSTPITIDGCRRERPTITGLNGYIYVMQGKGESTTVEGELVPRSKKAIIIYDESLNLVNRSELDFTYPLLHPQFTTFGGNIFATMSTDKRSFAYNSDGDTRAEISFNRIDDKLLLI